LIDLIIVALGWREHKRTEKESAMLSELRRAFTMLIALTLITGVAYPLLVTAIARQHFMAKRPGSLIERDGKAIGSTLIGQPFGDPKHFWSRRPPPRPIPTMPHPPAVRTWATQSGARRCRVGTHQGAARC